MKLLPRKAQSEPDTTAVENSMKKPGSEVDDNFVSPLRKGLFILIVGFGGFMLWAGLAPLGEGIPAPGSVKVVDNSKVVQNFTGGTVDAILVHNGEHVEAGEVLIKLDPTQARSKLKRVRAQYIIARVTEARLLAESTGSEHIEFDPELAQRFGDSDIYQRAVKIQTQLFKTRKETRQVEIDILKEKLASAREQLEGLKQKKASRRAQIQNLNKQLEGIRELAESGYLPRNKMLELERKAASLQANLASTKVEIGRVRSQIAELKLKILHHKQNFQKKVQAKLSNLQERTATLAAQLSALNYAVTQTKIRSPINGIVQNLQVHTVGGTISAGAKIMEIVPSDTKYVIHAKLPVQAIDGVHTGLPVQVTFPALMHANIPTIPGVVKTVSPSRIVNKRTGQPYYGIEVQVTDKGQQILARTNSALRAGMPAQVMIQLGERTLLQYLIEPFLERLNTAFTAKD